MTPDVPPQDTGTTQTQSSTPSPTPSAAPGTPSTSASPPTPSYSYPEDRSTWVPSNRLTAAERATNLAAQRAQQLERELEGERRRVQALAGVTPKDPDAEELEKVRAGFAQLYPNLAKMASLDPEKLERIIHSGESAEHLVRVQWDRHRAASLDKIKADVAQALGVETLSPTAARKVIAAFIASVPDPMYDRNKQPTNPEYFTFKDRYESNDPTLLAEFVTEFVSDFITPAQRAGLVRQRIAVPSGGASRPVATNPAQRPDYGKMKSPKEMLEAAELEVDRHYSGF